MLYFKDNAHITIVDGNKHHQPSSNIDISNEDIDFYIVNPTPFKMKVEITKGGSCVYSELLLEQQMKNYKDKVSSTESYVVNFFKSSSKIDSEVVLDHIGELNYETTPVERYSFTLTVLS